MFEVTRLNKLLVLVRDIKDVENALSLSENITMVAPVAEGCGTKYYNNILSETKSKDTNEAEVIYDCSNSFRDALEAMRLGAKIIKVTDDYKAYYKVIAIAAKYGVKVINKLPKKAKILKLKDKK